MPGSRIFNGSMYYQEPSAGSAYQSLSALTINARVRRTAAAQYTPIFSVISSSTAAVGFYWWNDNDIYMDVRNGSVKYRAVDSTLTGWHDVTGIFDGAAADASRMRIHINGVLQTTTGTTGNPTTTAASLTGYPCVGIEHQAGTRVSNGHNIAYVSVYNVALNQREIDTLCVNPMGVTRGRMRMWCLNGGNDGASHVEPDVMRIANLTAQSSSSTSASMLAPQNMTLGGRPQWR
jgi:hypothetical protein